MSLHGNVFPAYQESFTKQSCYQHCSPELPACTCNCTHYWSPCATSARGTPSPCMSGWGRLSRDITTRCCDASSTTNASLKLSTDTSVPCTLLKWQHWNVATRNSQHCWLSDYMTRTQVAVVEASAQVRLSYLPVTLTSYCLIIDVMECERWRWLNFTLHCDIHYMANTASFVVVPRGWPPTLPNARGPHLITQFFGKMSWHQQA